LRSRKKEQKHRKYGRGHARANLISGRSDLSVVSNGMGIHGQLGLVGFNDSGKKEHRDTTVVYLLSHEQRVVKHVLLRLV
jgi:hypothetical protein